MSVNKDFFRRRDFNYDFQATGQPPVGWAEADRLPEALVATHCAFCGVQCGMYLRVADGQVTGVEPRHFPHNEGHLCPKGVVAYQQVGHPDRLKYPMLRRGAKSSPLERCSWDERNLDPLVVIDFFLSETAELADVVLPGSVWCEDEGTTTNLEGRVIKINQAAEPPGEARRDVWIITELARRLGRGQFFPYQNSREISTHCGWPRRAGWPTTTASPGRKSTPRMASSGPVPS